MEAGGLLSRQPPQGPPGVAPGTIPVCAGQGPNGHAGNVLGQSAIHELNAGQLSLASQQQLHLQQQQSQQQMGQAPGMGEVLTPRRQTVVDRLRRRIESYRRRQTDCIPRFDQSFNGLCEQNTQDTQVLKQRFLESKAKRQVKKTDKKQNDQVGLSNVHMQQKFLKRTAEDLETAGGATSDGGFGEPQVKLQCTQPPHQHQQGPGGGGGPPHHGHGQHQPGNGANSTGPAPGGGSGASSSDGNEGLTKFQVQIVQQLEFTTSAANNTQGQAMTTISNVTVKTLANASVKSDLLNTSPSPKQSGPDTNASAVSRSQSGPGNGPGGPGGPGAGSGGTAGSAGTGGMGCVDIGNLVECKQEPDSEFVDLEQCAAALEKDAAANGTGFPGFPEFTIGDDTGDEIITSDAFKDLISEISDFHPEFMKDFDFEDKSVDTLANNAAAAAAAANNTNNSASNNGLPTTNNGQIKIEDDKDAIHQQSQNQQHANGANNGINNSVSANNGNTIPANSSPGALGSSQYSPARLPYSGLDFKSESPAAQTLKQMAEQHQHKSQQLGLGGFNPTAAAAAAAARGPTARSPYAEFPQFGGASDYLGSPGSTGPTGGQTQATAGNTGSYHKNNSAPTFQNQQTNDMFVSSQTQFATAGLADMKRPQPSATGGKPGMLGPSAGYKQQYSPYGSPGSMPNHGSPGYPLPPRGSQGAGPNQTGSQGPFNTTSTPPRPPSGPGTSTLSINQAQQLHIGNQIQVSAGQHMQLTGDLKPVVSVAAQQGMYFNQQQTQSQTGPANQTDTYCSVSQSQTINFTQQSLRQRAAAAAAAGGVPQPGAAGPGTRHPQQVPPSQVDQHQHAKLIQQQQLMRAQQVMQQQQHMTGGMAGVRPPPPEYKAAAQAQMMHASIGMSQQARFANAGPMRRVTQQPMPPSGPMMRPQMAQQQQQQALHAAGGNMYMGGGGMAAIGGMHQMHQRLNYPRTNNQRPPNVNVGPPDGLGNSIAGRGAQQEWRHVLMQQQQGFQAQMRSQFNQQGHQGGFGMGGTGSTMQMTAAQMQHQQLIRSQNGGIAGSGMANSTQMQQLLTQQHQQQTLAMQQNNNQMSLQMQMSQATSVNSASVTGTGSPLHPHQQYGAGSPGVRSLPPPQQHTQQPPPPPPPSVTTTDPSVAAADFSLEFLENLPTGDTSNFSAQELLNSLDSAGGFNLDIL